MNIDTPTKPIFEPYGSSAPKRYVAVSGATGFGGRALVARLTAMDGTNVLASTRKNPPNLVPSVKNIEACDLASQDPWQFDLAKVDTAVHDGLDLSTTELVRGMAHAAGVPARLLPVPVWALQAGGTLMGKADVVHRLCCNLQLNISKARSLLGWSPPVTVAAGLRRVVSGGGRP